MQRLFLLLLNLEFKVRQRPRAHQSVSPSLFLRGLARSGHRVKAVSLPSTLPTVGAAYSLGFFQRHQAALVVPYFIYCTSSTLPSKLLFYLCLNQRVHTFIQPTTFAIPLDLAYLVSPTDSFLFCSTIPHNGALPESISPTTTFPLQPLARTAVAAQLPIR